VESLRERKKHQTREDLERAALDLFEVHGFDGVTVDDIAARANVSPRTFFRYFGSKEAVLYADHDYLLSIMRDAISARPAEEHPLHVLRAALVAVTQHRAEHLEADLRRGRLVDTGPAIASYQRAVIQPAWEDMFTEALADRLATDPVTDPRPRLLAGVAIAVMSAAGIRWRASGGREDPVDLLLEAFEALDAAVLESRPD
jgi:AcrR family transcriptional regulator